MSQATSTFWDETMERVDRVAVSRGDRVSVRVNPAVKRRVRARRLTDAVILTIILGAAATCFSTYSRATAEFSVVLGKHQAAAEKVKDLTIKVQKLERAVEQLRTDSRVIEQVARQKFGFVRSGEVVIKLSQEPTVVGSTATVEGPVRVANLTPHARDGYTDASN